MFKKLSGLIPRCSVNKLFKTVDIPVSLYESTIGKYFVGYADNLTFGQGKNAWAWLYNPPDSGELLHVNVWTVTGVGPSPFRVQIWFNAVPPGTPIDSDLVTPSNTAISPLPVPKVKLQYASDVSGDPVGGIKAFVRRGEPETTLVAEEESKFIFPPGGSFLVYLSNPETPELSAEGRVAFGWWGEKINYNDINYQLLRCYPYLK